ncbi:hypothetical protein P43SY_011523 [Pythium insidiosum]|uniref:Integrase zinc-binding domain-containing protein n=1 Tax=Pythium insidiosum TaxID=114742 RepID=A0AAD5LSH8_PYTIN|nr:hypothetical protein P43SY_011523 [Pythium insidiosum]
MLHAAHDEFQGGHQGVARTFDRLRREFYWHNMYRDVERYAKECVDCSTAKGRPGNPASRQGNTSLLLFQDSFTGFVLAKAMQDTSALSVAQAYDNSLRPKLGQLVVAALVCLCRMFGCIKRLFVLADQLTQVLAALHSGGMGRPHLATTSMTS